MEITGRQTKKGENTKRRLYETAVALFEKTDFDKVSVDAIVKAAGVAKGTFYIYFESKDAMILSLLTEYVQNIDSDYKAHIDSLPEGTSASDMLISLLAKIVDILTDKIGYDRMRIVYKLQLTETNFMEVVKGYNRELYQIFTYVLGLGMEHGEFRKDIPLDTLTKHFVMAIRGLSYEWCIRFPDFDLKENVLMHFELLLSGIKTNKDE